MSTAQLVQQTSERHGSMPCCAVLAHLGVSEQGAREANIIHRLTRLYRGTRATGTRRYSTATVNWHGNWVTAVTGLLRCTAFSHLVRFLPENRKQEEFCGERRLSTAVQQHGCHLNRFGFSFFTYRQGKGRQTSWGCVLFSTG